jgi:hypothetical protein
VHHAAVACAFHIVARVGVVAVVDHVRPCAALMVSCCHTYCTAAGVQGVVTKTEDSTTPAVATRRGNEVRLRVGVRVEAVVDSIQFAVGLRVAWGAAGKETAISSTVLVSVAQPA